MNQTTQTHISYKKKNTDLQPQKKKKKNLICKVLNVTSLPFSSITTCSSKELGKKKNSNFAAKAETFFFLILFKIITTCC